MSLPHVIFMLLTNIVHGAKVVIPAPIMDTSDIGIVKEHLADHGLRCCIDVILRRSTWTSYGGGVDSIDDIRHLTEGQVVRLPMPQVKREILIALANQHRREHKQRATGWRDWLSACSAAVETLLRGFALGFGLSFIYETLMLNRDFYQSSEDLCPRIHRASLRAAVLGIAVAVTMYGAAIIVPHSLRHHWLA